MDTEAEIAEIAILGGVGFNSHRDCENIPIKTPFGRITAYLTSIKGRNIAIIPRHVEEIHIPPHRVNYRANIWAVHSLGVKRVISTNSVGSMRGHPVGSFVVLDDFIDFTCSRFSTFYDDKTVHVDVSEPYCPEIRAALRYSLEKKGIAYTEGVYACTEGPRFETRAEIRMMSQFADVVGMTGVPEVVLAKELSLCYASLATVTNQACGMTTQKLTAEEVTEVVGKAQDSIFEILSDAIGKIPETRNCMCRFAKEGACL
ncbi:5'-methylthioadenosine phosphorylase [Methanosarcina siciliae C2J]|uniref:Probable S-methyl-5'-thioinosine phosphorylase n=3 Tax=Methanosarcina siciliae TaxID=38027 RepID=A0A0E3PDJ7_9EURY|nr:S-methyl-5'-thioadenosine phosphorylase [Methanosarcina siciliae]AKB28417.1 5'-methylthioadenosine phosphorylase [Methanosarcina siciliae T4/M]AKB32238.1 5'-methylthioadenosine phosphorylase [Methanosarcina siciliae HI350]AKB36000.1 5'-methylthioadenosine phosphorylase [Methanosarcina siciliae C2J]